MNQRVLEPKELLQATRVTAAETVDGTGVDLQGYINPGGREMKAILSANAISGTTPTLDIKLQESDSLGTGYTDISGAAFTQVTTVDSLQEIHFRTSKRYVRAERVTTGTSPTYDLACLLLVEARYEP